MVFHTNSRGQNNKQKKSNESPLQEPHCSLHVHYFEQVHNITRPSLCQQQFSFFRKYLILPFVSYVFGNFIRIPFFASLFCAKFGMSVILNTLGFPCTILSDAVSTGRRRSIRNKSRLPVKLEKPVISYEITG